MLRKENRLSWKQINRLMWRGRKLYGKYFVCIAFPQRHFLPYNQRSITIPVKLDKRATMRNALKRRARYLFVELTLEYKVTTKRQLFFFLNKKSLDELKQLVATKNKTSIYDERIALCKKDFTYILRQLWTPWSNNGWTKQQTYSKK